jgi:hypothetical protein
MSKIIKIAIVVFSLITISLISYYLFNKNNIQQKLISVENSILTKKELSGNELAPTEKAFTFLEDQSEKDQWVINNDNVKILVTIQPDINKVGFNRLDIYKTDSNNKLIETAIAYNFYSTFDEAVTFAATTPYDKIQNYAGKKEDGKLYERYSITKLADILNKQTEEKKNTDQSIKFCGEPDILDYYAENMRFYFPRKVTFEEVVKCYFVKNGYDPETRVTEFERNKYFDTVIESNKRYE